MDREQIEALACRLTSGEEFLSYSSLTNFAESPKHFLEYKFKTKEKTDAMIFGNVVHCLILEPSQFEKRYAICPPCDRRTTVGKKIYADFQESSAGKQEITSECHLSAQAMVNSIRMNLPANRIIQSMQEKELSVEWEFMGFKHHGFIDGFTPLKFMCDIKTCADANPRKFQRDIVQMDYHVQAAMYLEGKEADVPYYIIAADKTGGVSVHLLDERLINAGIERYKFLIESLNRCILLDAWDKSYDFYSERHDGIFLAEKPSYLY